jgi:hypothetical protein
MPPTDADSMPTLGFDPNGRRNPFSSLPRLDRERHIDHCVIHLTVARGFQEDRPARARAAIARGFQVARDVIL